MAKKNLFICYLAVNPDRLNKGPIGSIKSPCLQLGAPPYHTPMLNHGYLSPVSRFMYHPYQGDGIW